MFVGPFALAAACSPPPPPPPAPHSPPPATATAAAAAPTGEVDPEKGRACRENVAGLRSWLNEVDAVGSPIAMLLSDDGANLVERSGPPVADTPALVHLGAGATVLDGVSVADDEALVDKLAARLQLNRRITPDSPFLDDPRCVLAIDASVPWSRVVGVISAASRAGVRVVTFLFADPGRPVPQRPTSDIDPDLARLPGAGAARRLQIIAELMAHVYQDCPPALKVIASWGAHEIVSLKKLVLDELPEAIAWCGCAPDVSSVKALHWALFGNPRPVSGLAVRVLEPGDAGTVEVVKAPADQPWSKAYEAIVPFADSEQTKAVRLVAEPSR